MGMDRPPADVTELLQQWSNGKEQALERAIEDGTLGRGSVAGDEYQRNMEEARQFGKIVLQTSE